MSEIDPATAGTRIAVELLTSWMEQDQQSAAERIERVLNDPNGPGASNIIAGQCNLGVLLVLWLAQERGARSTDDLMADAAESSAACPGMSPSSGALTPPPGPGRRRRGV